MSSHNSSFYSALPHQPSFRSPAHKPPNRTKPDQWNNLDSSKKPLKCIEISSQVPVQPIRDQENVILQGLLLCVCEMKNGKSPQDFDQLKKRQRQMKLDWQELNAKLGSNQIELFQQTDNKRVHRIPLSSRHCIAYLNMVSPQDCCWSLEIKPRMSIHQGLGSSTGRYLFMARTIEQSREWYTALYRTLAFHSKKPMPLLAQINVPLCDVQVSLCLEIISRNTKLDIRMGDIKRGVIHALVKQGLLEYDFNMPMDLYWRFESQEEWVQDTPTKPSYLVGPQLIEQTHSLELKLRNPPIKELGVWFEDEVVWLRKESQQMPIYCLQSGSFLFLIDLNKALLWNTPYHGHRPRFTRFSLATYLSTRSSSIQHPRPNSACSLPNPSDFDRRLSNILNAFGAFDLSRAHNITIGSHRNIRIHTHDSVLELQASSDHTLREWVIRLQQGSQHSTISNGRVRYPEIDSDLIWKASMLYVKRGRRSTFKQYLCVLTRHRGLILFDKYKRSYWTSKAKTEPVYRRSPNTLSVSKAYVYTSPSCVKDMIRTKARNQSVPPKMFEDGMTESSHAIQLLFVVYQPPDPTNSWIRRKISPKSVWIFQARDKEEKEAWVWALDQAKEM